MSGFRKQIREKLKEKLEVQLKEKLSALSGELSNSLEAPSAIPVLQRLSRRLRLRLERAIGSEEAKAADEGADERKGAIPPAWMGLSDEAFDGLLVFSNEDDAAIARGGVGGWLPASERIAGNSNYPLFIENPAMNDGDLVANVEWAPEEVQLPERVERVPTLDFRKGYRHVWALSEVLENIRRPYLLRTDLARVVERDETPVEELLVVEPLSYGIEPLAPPEWCEDVEWGLGRTPGVATLGVEQELSGAWLDLIELREAGGSLPKVVAPETVSRSSLDASAGEPLTPKAEKKELPEGVPVEFADASPQFQRWIAERRKKRWQKAQG